MHQVHEAFPLHYVRRAHAGMKYNAGPQRGSTGHPLDQGFSNIKRTYKIFTCSASQVPGSWSPFQCRDHLRNLQEPITAGRLPHAVHRR